MYFTRHNKPFVKGFLETAYRLLSQGLCLLTLCIGTQALAQPGSEIEIKKPKKYENRKLGAEKSNDKKFTAPKRFMQNTVTHYNYYFNAKTRLYEVIDRAKQSYKDDFTQPLSFYNYTLEATAQSAGELDSVIYKCTAGIVLHNLNNDWIDDMYLIMGKAYFYRKNYDSAANVFQYINYAFAPKDGGYDIPLGSNISNTNGLFTIATKEKKGLWKKITSKPPARNEALLWMARLYLINGQLAEAASLLELLKKDPQFPERLQPQLTELEAFYYFTNSTPDSAAVKLVALASNHPVKEEKARWLYLAAQQFQKAGKLALASDTYLKAANTTLNPVLEVYGNLNGLKLAANTEGKNNLATAIQNLQKLAKKERYLQHNDIIYYAIAQLYEKAESFTNQQKALETCVAVALPTSEVKPVAWLDLAKLHYKNERWVAAANALDSTQFDVLKDSTTARYWSNRKADIKILATNSRTISEQDSLQVLAKLSADSIKLVVKKIFKELKKKEGIKIEEETGAFINPATANTAAASSVNLFDNNAKGDWYFNNSNLKSQGANEFKNYWGKRSNVDNWRRQDAVDKAMAQTNFTDPDAMMDVAPQRDTKTDKGNGAQAATLEGLLENIPTTPAKLFKSNTAIQQAILENQKILSVNLANYPPAIGYYYDYKRRYPGDSGLRKALFYAHYDFKQIGNVERADSALRALQQQFPLAVETKQLTQKNISVTDSSKDIAANYATIYNNLLAGKFEEALAAKKQADAKYGNHFWTPQLLYIESIYYVKKEQDAQALETLRTLVSKFPTHALATKANTMIDVVSRRKDIVNYLTQLQVEKPVEENTPIVDFSQPAPAPKTTTPVAAAPAVVKPAPTPTTAPIVVKKDTVVAVKVAKQFSYAITDSQYIAIVLTNVDPVYVNETKNAFTRFNRERFYNQKFNYIATA
ncbi:MAG: hypothetical protein EAY68_04995, partial [Bacteroidetes bacterium]